MSINADFQSLFLDLQSYAHATHRASLSVIAADGSAHVSTNAASLKNIDFKTHFANLAFNVHRIEGRGFADLPEELRKKIKSDTRVGLNGLRDRVHAMLKILTSKEELDKSSSKTAYERLRKAFNIEAACAGKPLVEADDNDGGEVVPNIHEKIAFCKALIGNNSLSTEELPPALRWYQRKFGEIMGYSINNGRALAITALVASVAVARSYFNL